jgi:hypothetical protein
MSRAFAPEPCGSCPYRRDVVVGTWHADEFENLLAHDADPIRGAVFGCHRFRMRRDTADVCAGWFLDQQRRGFPSIQLRVAIMRADDEPRVTDGGHPLYLSVKAMCRANGVRRARFRGDRGDA